MNTNILTVANLYWFTVLNDSFSKQFNCRLV